MTIEFFERMCDIDSDKTYVSKAKLNDTELPLYAVEEKSISVTKRNTNTTATIREPITTI